MNRNKFSKKEVFDEVNAEAFEVTEDDIKYVVDNDDNIKKKSSKLEIGKYRRFIRQIKLLLNLLRDYKNKKYTEIPWKSVALITAAILYFINPFDVMPDIIPLLGFADDTLLFAAVFKSIQTDLEKYSEWKGVNSDNLF